MRLLLVTGAGASRDLGRDEPMPLMNDWSNRLCEALDERELGLAAAACLHPGMTGEQFESALGLLLRWQQVRGLEERFQGLGGRSAGTHYDIVESIRDVTTQRLQMIMQTLNATLYEQFGQHRVDDARAHAAYAALLTLLRPTALAVATTNYDRAGEAALESFGYEVNTGFRFSAVRTPVLEPVEMLKGVEDDVVPFLHLHGAVGWYEKGGKVENHYADQPYNPSLGTPVVLYPDPEKDPTSDAIVSQLWHELEHIVDWADGILVIGHSLHDPALVRMLTEASRQKPVAVTCHLPQDAERIPFLLPEAQTFSMEFGPQPRVERASIELFVEAVVMNAPPRRKRALADR